MADPKNTAAPETVNREQNDEPKQAQSVAKDALERATAPLGVSGDTVKPEGAVTDEDNAKDVVDRIEEARQGTIDMEAYRGETNHDDYVEKYGKDRRPGDTPVDADS